MPKKYIPQEPKADRMIHTSYSLKLAVALKSAEQAQVIHIIHGKLLTKSKKPLQYNDYYFIRGCWWTVDTFQTWQEKYFPLSNPETVRTSFFAPLIKNGILIKDNFDSGALRRSWLTINYERLHQLFPFTEQTYPNLNKGNPVKPGTQETQLNKKQNPVKLEPKPSLSGIETQLNKDSIIYNNKYIYKTDISTLYSTERSTEKTALTESEKRIDGDSGLNEIFEAFENYTGTSFDDTESMDLIKNLLQSGYSVTDLVGVIKCKADEWKDSEKMRPCIRPRTLFKTDKFSEYLDTARNKGYVPKPLLPVAETLFNSLSRNERNYLTDNGVIDADFNIDFLKLRKLDNGSRNPFSLNIADAINWLSKKGDARFTPYMFVPEADMNTLREIGFINDENPDERSWLNVTDDVYEEIILTYGIG